jgi:hypothetical protein
MSAFYNAKIYCKIMSDRMITILTHMMFIYAFFFQEGTKIFNHFY